MIILKFKMKETHKLINKFILKLKKEIKIKKTDFKINKKIK